MESGIWYFAYGSNMDSKQLEERINREDIKGIVGKVLGYELAFNKIASNRDGEGKANIVPRTGGVIYGVLYSLDMKDLEKLDSFAGMPTHYIRVKIPVETEGEIVEAVSYVAATNMVKEGLTPSREYLEHLIIGAKEHRLPDDYIQKLCEIKCLSA